MQIPAFNSSAVESIATADGNVVITFKGGRDYTYGVADLEKFLTELTSTVNAQGSVGRFVNNAIRSEVLTAVAA
jgi:hypothetical protein